MAAFKNLVLETRISKVQAICLGTEQLQTSLNGM